MAGYQQPTVNEDGEDAATNGHGTAPQPAPAPEPEPAPAAQPSKDFLQLRFVDQNDAEVTFKLKPTTKLKKAMDAYSARAERDRLTLRFMFDGQRIQEETTPADLDLEDNDKIDVYVEQLGGGGGEQPAKPFEMFATDKYFQELETAMEEFTHSDVLWSIV